MRPRIELLLLTAAVAPLAAQGRTDLDLLYGRWYQGNDSKSYELRTDAPLTGIFSHGFVAQALIHDTLGRHHAFYGAGWQLHALRHRAVLGPYALAAVALGLSTDTTSQRFAALWSVGGGVEWRPVPWIAVAIEALYRLQDDGPRGFWRAGPGRRDGVSGAVGLSLGLGAAPRRGSHERTPPTPPRNISGNAAEIVQTALAVVGTPYEWGGNAANGFDCSGLIQYAYAKHGIWLPRTSHEQAASGSEVTPVVGALQPGDILLFAAQPGRGVTHVGMYVGNGIFIHSANSGVILSRLDPQDADAGWWLSRWVGARRIVQ